MSAAERRSRIVRVTEDGHTEVSGFDQPNSDSVASTIDALSLDNFHQLERMLSFL
jgi:hypothetical protein